ERIRLETELSNLCLDLIRELQQERQQQLQQLQQQQPKDFLFLQRQLCFDAVNNIIYLKRHKPRAPQAAAAEAAAAAAAEAAANAAANAAATAAAAAAPQEEEDGADKEHKYLPINPQASFRA
ncbi:hypothetical protein ETH_00037870, partial [Eimeria tenella]